jgi:hypothetical protein
MPVNDRRAIVVINASLADRPLTAPLREYARVYSIDSNALEASSRVNIGWSRFLSKFATEHKRELRSGDIIIVAGDRYEVVCYATFALQHGCEVWHIGGGETSPIKAQRYMPDHYYRNAITHMASKHFVANHGAASTVQGLIGGARAQSEQILVTGLPSLDRVWALAQTPAPERCFGEVLFAMHSDPNEPDSGLGHFMLLYRWIAALQAAGRVNRVFFSWAGPDLGGRQINAVLRTLEGVPEDLRAQWEPIKRIGDQVFLNQLRTCEFAVGNSSAFRLEAGLFGTPCLEVGDRQFGRFTPEHIAQPGVDFFEPQTGDIFRQLFLSAVALCREGKHPQIFPTSNYWGAPDGKATEAIGAAICAARTL